MIEKYLGFKRLQKNQIDLNAIIKMRDDINKPKIEEFNSSISPIWQKVINNHGKDIFKLLTIEDPQFIKGLFENFFVNGLSDGAAVGEKMNKLKTMFKIKKREQRRLDILNHISASQNTNLNFNLYDFGQPWLMHTSSGRINFELIDHYYFALFAISHIKNVDIREVIFLGDGCGYLAQCLFELDKNNIIKKGNFIDLYHFLCRQYLLLTNGNKARSLKFFNAEAAEYRMGKSPKILINQDSFPEISQDQQNKYFKMMKTNNVRVLISYNKIDKSFGHFEFRKQADDYFKNKVFCGESQLRKGYWLEVWHAL